MFINKMFNMLAWLSNERYVVYVHVLCILNCCILHYHPMRLRIEDERKRGKRGKRLFMMIMMKKLLKRRNLSSRLVYYSQLQAFRLKTFLHCYHYILSISHTYCPLSKLLFVLPYLSSASFSFHGKQSEFENGRNGCRWENNNNN